MLKVIYLLVAMAVSFAAQSATLLELHDVVGDPGTTDLRKKVVAAIALKAHAIAIEATPTAEEIIWAKEALIKPAGKLEQVLHYIIAEAQTNTPGITVAAIQSASDTAIQSFVDNAVDNLLSK